MCGIIGCIGTEKAPKRVLNGLKNLEYRGYDSAGIAIGTHLGIDIRKQEGKISELLEEFSNDIPTSTVSIGHTRWATHGPPNDVNAHPHSSNSGRIAVVHNGIISNHSTLQERCENAGYHFSSETDTEVIAHLMELHLDSGEDINTAFINTVDLLEGSYAIALIVAGQNRIFAARQGSPLLLGLDDGVQYLASDVPAFLDHTDEVIYLEDGDLLEISASGHQFLKYGGDSTERPITRVDWDPEQTSRGDYEHFMYKEIDNQPESLSKTIEGRTDPLSGHLGFSTVDELDWSDIEEVQFVGCGTSFHAGLYGERLFNERNIRSQAFRASEYDGVIPTSERTLVIAITQSGETADTIEAIRTAKENGARTLAVTNVVGSSITREADDSVYIRAGPEIGVAATKTFSSQVISISMLAEQFAAQIDGAHHRENVQEFIRALEALPGQINEVLQTSEVDDICRQYIDCDEYYFIGSGYAYPVALEGALKFKEITYRHAEAFASGELKHGPLALISSGVPVFAIFNGVDDERTRINAIEAQARGAEIIAIVSQEAEDMEFADHVLPIPHSDPTLIPLLANVELQLVAYHTARILERPIDKPRNLAKSVTVS